MIGDLQYKAYKVFTHIMYLYWETQHFEDKEKFLGHFYIC